ncbi:hypothetical protein SAY86_015520 [Trapa natans]|uniref:Subtilisin-like protease n=1 Tax=Trapa natans TaxID=22666 RepID=A0AAN7LEA5_TRANT|nr:hypothetical protein SAY86_015520 [Trapa natans]
MTGSLDPSKAAGKIVICDRGGNSRAQKGVVVRDAGGLGMILANTEYYGEELVADPHVLPSAALGQKAGDEVKKYASSVRNPTAAIASGGTQLGIQPSPVVAAFSSRGPNPLDPRVLKPDIIAPGVNILAGWTGAVGPTGLSSDKRRGAGRSTNIVKYTRTVTNVGNPGTYVVSISSESRAVKISVEPGVLSFSAVNEKKSYTVTFVARSMPSGTTSFARLEWSDGKHKVKSPIVFTWT